MKKSLLFAMLLLTSLGHANFLPKPSGQVNDYAHVLSKADGDSLEDQLRNIAKTGPGIVAIIAPDLQGMNGMEFAQKAISEWKIGNERGGVLLLIAMKERKIQVATDSVAKTWLADSECDEIFSVYMRPAAKRGDWKEALSSGADNVNTVYQNYQNYANPPRVNDEYKGVINEIEERNKFGGIALSIIIICLVATGVVFAYKKQDGDNSLFESSYQNHIPKKLTPSQKKRKAEALARAKAKRLVEAEKRKKINIEKKKAHKMAKRIRVAVSAKLKKLDPIEKKKAKKILHRWKSASKSDRRWVSSRIPAMSQYINVQRSSSGFGVMDFLFWHWVLFPSVSHSSNSGYSSSSSNYEPSYSSSSSSSSWSSSSFGSSSSSSSGGFSGGGSSGGGGGGGF